MKSNRRYVLVWLMLVGGCSVFPGGSDPEIPAQETSEAIRLEAILLEAKGLAGSAIDITITEEKILLEGFVETPAQRQRAEALVRKNSSLNSISNRLTVK